MPILAHTISDIIQTVTITKICYEMVQEQTRVQISIKLGKNTSPNIGGSSLY